ncbi:MAG: fibronectin type III domain-containing protein [Methanobacteriota archaeon]
MGPATPWVPVAVAPGPETGPVTLYFHSAPHGVGPVDVAAGGASRMDPTPPTKAVPSLWHSMWSVTDDEEIENPFDAHWTWSPPGSFAFDGMRFRVVFYASEALAGFFDHRWQALLYVDGALVSATPPEEGFFRQRLPGEVSEYEITLAPVSVSGASLTLVLDPWFLVPDGSNAIYYDAVLAPSRLEVAPPPPPPGDPLDEPTVLHLHRGKIGVGNVDNYVAGSPMDPAVPVSGVPAAWHSMWRAEGASPTSIFTANWIWRPPEGFAFVEAPLRVSFPVVAPLAQPATFPHHWIVRLYADGVLVASNDVVDGTEVPAALPGVPQTIQIPFGPATFSGRELVLHVKPVFTAPDGENVVLYDAAAYDATLELDALDLPPPAVSGLTVTDVSPSEVALAWSPAIDDVGLAGYRVYRAVDPETASLVATVSTTVFSDAGLLPSTAYRFEVAALDVAGQEGPRAVTLATTLAPDPVAPEILGLAVETGAAAIAVSWATDERATGRVEFGADATYGRVVGSPLGTSHRVYLTGLSPGSVVHFRVLATDRANNTNATGDELAATGTLASFYLHNRGPPNATVRYANEFNESGDNDARGWNAVGAVAATLDTWTFSDVLLPAGDTFATAGPENSNMTLDLSQAITATVFVRFPTALPVAGEVSPDSAGVVLFELTVFANSPIAGDPAAGFFVGSDFQPHVVTPGEGWVPMTFTVLPNIPDVGAGTLYVEFRPRLATSAYQLGYEGDHASVIRFPLVSPP